jgi:hypothetical protein
VELLRSGNTETTKVGFVNKHDQFCTGHRGVTGTNHGQVLYRIVYMRASPVLRPLRACVPARIVHPIRAFMIGGESGVLQISG